MDIEIEASWKKVLSSVVAEKWFEKLRDFVRKEYLSKTIYPQPKNLFAAFNKTPFEKVSVVILGQDPYHGTGQAHGLCFSVPQGVPLPPSLRNIFKEISADIGIEKDYTNGNLDGWAEQGVLLLNAVLTVEKDKAASHAGQGWELFTDEVIKKISSEKEHCVFILWGTYARKKKELIDSSKHLVLESAHPSPLSAHNGFFGNKHFSQTNTYLKNHSKKEIVW